MKRQGRGYFFSYNKRSRQRHRVWAFNGVWHNQTDTTDISTASSEPGRGTIFRIYLPPIEKETEKAKAEEHIALSGGTETILLAEDEEEVRKLMKLVLEEAGYKVIEAVDGKEAIEKVWGKQRQHKPSSAFDMIMPKITTAKEFTKRQTKKINLDVKALFFQAVILLTSTQKGILKKGCVTYAQNLFRLADFEMIMGIVM